MSWVLNLIPHITIMVGGKPYLTRYYLLGKERPLSWFNLFLHHFHASDGDRELHNHPWPGRSLILRGGYVEERCYMRPRHEAETQPWDPHNGCLHKGPGIAYTNTETKVFLPGNFNEVGLTAMHRVTLLDETKGCWTLFLAGKRTKDWGFLDHQTGEFTHWETKPGAVP